jgi:Leucine-rich repeat (LRR) protein
MSLNHIDKIAKTFDMDDDDLEEIPVRPYSDKPDSIDSGDSGSDDFKDEDSTIQPPSHSRKNRRMTLIIGVVVVMVIVGLVTRFVWDAQEIGNAMAMLGNQGITLADAFTDKDSPQSLAIQWMMRQDPAKLNMHDSRFIQRYVVATMIFAVAVASPKIDLLRSDMHFLSGSHECDWGARWENKGANALLDMGVRCDESRKVNKIILPGLGLEGHLPNELGSLDHLTDLLFDANEITGLIPHVPSLTSISLAYNNIEGTLPEYLGLMTNLEELILTENLITGHLPEIFQDLAKLKRFAISGNEISEGIHHLFQLTALEEIYAAFNALEDAFDDDSFAKLSNLRILDLRNNKLQGSFPNAIWTLPKLKVVDFHFNDLDGYLNEIKEDAYPVLAYLDVSVNFLGGGVPNTLNKVTTLEHLDISANRFDKQLVGDFGALTNLKTLLMTDNNLLGPGPIPDWLQGLSNLEYLSLKLTARTGTIPGWFFDNLKQLKTLDLDWNRISGIIPSNIGNVTSLEHLLLNRNWLSGNIPTVLHTLPNLKTLMLDNNRLVGEIQSCQASVVVADCGDPSEGCPNCVSETMEVSCPCCTR